MRRSSLQQIDVQISREISTEYDKVKIVADNIATIENLANAIENGFDFDELVDLGSTVVELDSRVDSKVDKVVGKALSDENYTLVEKTKLGLIADEATKNSTDVELRDRTTHTGLQTLDTTTDTATRVAMTPAERSKLGLVADGANNYTHPSTHPISILDGTGNDGRFVKVDNVGNVGFDYVSWADVNGKPSAYTPAVHIHDMAEVVTGSIDASRVTTSTARRFVSDTQVGMVDGSEQVVNKGQAGGYAPLNMSGKVDLQYLSSLSILDVYTPANEASMLALSTAGVGDIAWRQDTQSASILVALPASTRANWKDLTLIGVTSVNGQQGVLTLDADDISETATTKYYTDERVDDRVAALLKAGTNITLTYDDVLGTLTLNVDDAYVAWSEIQSKPTTISGFGITDASTTTQMNTALALKANIASPVFTGNVTGLGVATGTSFNGVTGLAGVAPVAPAVTAVLGSSTLAARQDHVHPTNFTVTATDIKANGTQAVGTLTTFPRADHVHPTDTTRAPLASPTFTGTVGGITKTMVGLGNVDNTSDANKPVSTAVTTLLGTVNLTRADKYLAAQNVANMVYSSGNLVKIQYNNATDVDYEVLSYTLGSLTNIAHYVNSVLNGNTVLTYSSGTLVSAVFTGV